MISAEETLAYLKTKPFRPFRLNMSGGRTFDVLTPNLLCVTRHYLLLFTMSRNNPDVYIRFKMMGHEFVESIRFLDVSNG